MINIKITPIGDVNPVEDGFAITLKNEYKDGLTAIEGFSHLNIIWWADKIEDIQFLGKNVISKPYVNGPDNIGVFATRAPMRPNRIAITPVFVSKIDYERGIIYTPYIDAEPGTPILDIKPYQPSMDVVKEIALPAWCVHWPKSIEESALFNWENEFNF